VSISGHETFSSYGFLEKDININLLLDCLGRKNSAEVAERLCGASNEKWRQLLELAWQSGLGPLFYSRVKVLLSDNKIPPEITKQLRHIYIENTARNTLFYHELSNILEAFNKVNIPVILLKGAYLAEKIYEDIGLRPMLDIDLLLRKKDLAKGNEVLINLGYSKVKQIDIDIESAQRHHISRLIKGCLPVELHWHIFPPKYPFSVDIDQIWERAVKQKIADKKLLVLSLEDLLLHLCEHASFHHVFEQDMKSLYDIKMVIEKCKDVLQWDIFIERAFAWKVERCAYLTLRMVQNFFGIELADTIIVKLKPEELPPQIMPMAEELLLARVLENYKISTCLAQVWKAEKLGERVSLFLKRVFPSRQEIATMYPVLPGSLRIYMYYPVRIKDLLFRYGRGAFGLARKDKDALGLAEQRQKEEELRTWLEKR
jgi:hypothetical protein